ncbi:MAG: 50S ribosomal protein L24 [Pirellulales bacterium]|nr:50S ribosomal protein L24 [Pirellulales bacterium]
MHIRVDDTVKVIAGNDRGETGKVQRVIRDKATRKPVRVVVEGMNRVYKHVRRSQRNPQGGRLSTEMPMSIANVQLVCPVCGQASRTGSRLLDDGSKERFCKKCGKGIGQIAPPHTAGGK